MNFYLPILLFVAYVFLEMYGNNPTSKTKRKKL